MGLFDFLGDLATAGSQVHAANQVADQANREMQLNRENFRFQRRQFRYERNLQQEIFDREDNAVQRRAADLEAAGLSPVLAAGQGARAGDAIKVNAPQHDPSAGRAAKLQQAQIAQGAAKAIADVGLTRANAKLAEAQAKKTNAEAEVATATVRPSVDLVHERLKAAQLENHRVSESMDDVLREVREQSVTARHRRVIAEAQAAMSEGEKNYFYAMQARIREEAIRSGRAQPDERGGYRYDDLYYDNPQWVEYAAARAILKIQEENAAFIQTQKTLGVGRDVLRILRSLFGKGSP